MPHKKRTRRLTSDRVPELALERLPEALVLLDDDRRYVRVNEEACALLGLSRDALLSRRADDVVATPRAELDAIWNALLAHGTAEGVVPMRHASEGVVQVDFRARANVSPGLHVSVLRRVRSEGAPPTTRVRSFADLLTMQEALLAADATLESVMRLICERAIDLTGAEGATVEMEDGDDLVYRVTSGTMAPYAGFRLARRQSLSGLALTTARVLVCDDSEADPRVNVDACRRVGARSMVVVPLLHDQRVVGVLKITSGGPRAFDAHVVETLRLLAGFLGAAIVRAEAQDMRNALARAERERVLELERLRAELSSLVVHDLRSPLASVIMNLQYLRDELPAGSEHAVEAAADALAATKRLDDLIRLLLEIARLESKLVPVERRPVRPAELIAALRADRARQARERNVRIESRVAPEDEIRVDASLFRRLLDNIVDNALRYTPDGGVIELASHLDRDTYELRIGNSGEPIPAEARERIFDKFVNVGRRVRESFGLGLYFCRLVAEAHGGSISVDSSEELPTIFVVRLPLGDARRS